jgi:hypothetical protein
MPAEGREGEAREDEAVIYIPGDHFTINVPYAKVRAKWMQIKKGST